MACPDELTLDLWLAGALPAEEAAAVAAHAAACATCAAVERAARALEGELHAALALDADEQAYLSGLNLAARWPAEPAAATPTWGWIALAGAVAAYVAWLAGGAALGATALAAGQLALGTLPLDLAVGSLFELGQGLLEISRNPNLGLATPTLALLALALLAWPRQLAQQRSTHA